MADGFNAPSYVGGQLLASGLSQFGQGLGGGLGEALQKYEEDKARVGMADITMEYAKTVPGAVSPEALQRYHQANAKEKAYIAMGAQSNLKNMLQRQQEEWQNRISAAHANYYLQAAQRQAAEAEAGPGGSPGKGKIWSDELGGWATPAQADAAKRRSTQGYLMQSYGLTPEQIFDSKQHEAGTVTIDPATGAKKFTNDEKGDQIRIGGGTGVIMPKAEHEVYKRQLQQSGFQPGGAPGGGAAGARAPGAGAGAGGPQAGTVRVRSPQGVIGTIPANRLQEAQNAGYTPL
jgi:hypothetical protein